MRPRLVSRTGAALPVLVADMVAVMVAVIVPVIVAYLSSLPLAE
jgi:hypothetical protein